VLLVIASSCASTVLLYCKPVRWRLEFHQMESWSHGVIHAYHCDWTSKFENETTAVDKKIRENLWKLSIPGKIKIHGWRLLNGFIPCKGVLFSRHIGENSYCPICPSSSEDIKHMMFMCDRAICPSSSEDIKHMMFYV
jgi:hypothetical protein